MNKKVTLKMRCKLISLILYYLILYLYITFPWLFCNLTLEIKVFVNLRSNYS